MTALPELGLGADHLALLNRPNLNMRSSENLEAARAAAEQFEAVFISQMLAPMFEGISTDGPFGGGNAEQVWRSQMLEQYGRDIAANGGLGIADQVMQEILRAQENVNS